MLALLTLMSLWRQRQSCSMVTSLLTPPMSRSSLLAGLPVFAIELSPLSIPLPLHSSLLVAIAIAWNVIVQRMGRL